MALQVAKAQSVTLTLARVILGGVFLAHGWQKVFTNGLDATAAAFTAMGVPAPTLSAWFAGLAELIGGALLIVGFAVPLVALVLIVNMLGAIVTVHLDKGFFTQGGGYELPLVLIAGLIAVAVSYGTVSVDGALFKKAGSK